MQLRSFATWARPGVGWRPLLGGAAGSSFRPLCRCCSGGQGGLGFSTCTCAQDGRTRTMCVALAQMLWSSPIFCLAMCLAYKTCRVRGGTEKRLARPAAVAGVRMGLQGAPPAAKACRQAHLFAARPQDLGLQHLVAVILLCRQHLCQRATREGGRGAGVSGQATHVKEAAPPEAARAAGRLSCATHLVPVWPRHARQAQVVGIQGLIQHLQHAPGCAAVGHRCMGCDASVETARAVVPVCRSAGRSCT